MAYVLGIDLGTSNTAAAVLRDGEPRPVVVELGDHSASMPSVVFLTPDGRLLVGDAAERRATAEPTRVARHVKRRVGDPVPVLLEGTPFGATTLLAELARHVLRVVHEREGGPPRRVALTHPANWGPWKREQLHEVARLTGLGDVVTLSEPEAAAIHFADRARVDVGRAVAVYDLGGGTFDATVLRLTGDGYEVAGEPQGIEHLGGADFDEAILAHVAGLAGHDLRSLDVGDVVAQREVAALRRACVEAKEALSADSDVVVSVALAGRRSDIRLTRAELERLIAPTLAQSVAALERAVASSGIEPAALQSVLLVGGSSRVPLVSQLVTSALGRPVASDTHPKHTVALGAAIVAARGPGGRGAALDGAERPGATGPHAAPAAAPAGEVPGGPGAAAAGLAATVALAGLPAVVGPASGGLPGPSAVGGVPDPSTAPAAAAPPGGGDAGVSVGAGPSGGPLPVGGTSVTPPPPLPAPPPAAGRGGGAPPASPPPVTFGDRGGDPGGPGQGAPANERRRRGPVAAPWLVLGALGVVIVIAAVAWLLVPARSASATEVFAEPSGSTGPDPFTDSVAAPELPPTTTTTTPPTSTSAAGAPSAVQPETGDRVGLYGGSLDLAVCDVPKLVGFLLANPEKATAWASVQGLAVSGLRAYIEALTPVVLTVDVRVTNHGFADGRATPRQSVLQAGTAVLVDRFGVPRARCYCGNPLTPPREVSPRYTGTTWAGFERTSYRRIFPAAQPVDTFIVVDLTTGRLIEQPAGLAAVASSSTTTTPSPTTTAAPPATSTTAPPTTTTSPPQLQNLALMGVASASSVFPTNEFPASASIDGDVTTSWFSAGPGAVGTSVYSLALPGAFTLRQLDIINNSQHEVPDVRRGFGFGQVVVEVRDGGVVTHTSTHSLAGDPDPDVSIPLDDVRGSEVRLSFTGHEDHSCGGFSELQVIGF